MNNKYKSLVEKPFKKIYKAKENTQLPTTNTPSTGTKLSI